MIRILLYGITITLIMMINLTLSLALRIISAIGPYNVVMYVPGSTNEVPMVKKEEGGLN